jgi:undecaprenyl diphosphate synthase
MAVPSYIDPGQMPKHIAIIMDGNGRWAKNQGKIRVFGHKHGVEAVREVSEGCAELGVKFLTLYAFSTENWNRPKLEVDALMSLLVKTIKNETATLQKNNIKLAYIGDKAQLPSKCVRELDESIAATSKNDGMTLILALSYSSKWDIVQTVKTIASDALNNEISIEDIDETMISQYLTTGEFPHPELMIRTSGEQRISNFLLWELAYSEFYFTNTLWPDFRKKDLYAAIEEYQKRERRFGKTEDQILQKENKK